MDALVMCGGRGTRLSADCEKPLFEIDGVPMVDRVCDALAEAAVDAVSAAVSPATPRTREHVRERGDCTVVETPGDGYVADLSAALEELPAEGPVLTCVADLPLVAPDLVTETVEVARDGDPGSLTVAVPAALKASLDVSADTTFEHQGWAVAPTGLNVVGDGGEAVHLSFDARLAVNVNRVSDARVAERLCPPVDT